METFDAISKRASVRTYSTQQLERSILEKLVDAGRRAPTARAVEPWQFIVVTEKPVLKRLGEIADHGPFIKDAVCCIAVFCEDTKYYLEDGCAATENILIAAADMGLGACWVAGDKKDYCSLVSELLEVPSELKLISLIPVGYSAQDTIQKKHKELKDVIHWGIYNK